MTQVKWFFSRFVLFALFSRPCVPVFSVSWPWSCLWCFKSLLFFCSFFFFLLFCTWCVAVVVFFLSSISIPRSKCLQVWKKKHSNKLHYDWDWSQSAAKQVSNRLWAQHWFPFNRSLRWLCFRQHIFLMNIFEKYFFFTWLIRRELIKLILNEEWTHEYA